MLHFSFKKSRILLVVISVLLASGLLASVSYGVVAQTPAAVVLDYFSVIWDPNLEVAVISWKTVSELDTAGFMVERAIWPSGTFTPTGDFEPAIGDQATGDTYGPFFDTEVFTGTTYWYQLVIYGRNGQVDRSLPRAILGSIHHVFLPTILNGG